MTTPFRLTLPSDVSAAEWLSQHDNAPRLLPRWPESQRMTLVAVVRTPVEPGGLSAAYVITRREQVDAFYPGGHLNTLFFSVPRAVVLDDEIRPANLAVESWE